MERRNESGLATAPRGLAPRSLWDPLSEMRSFRSMFDNLFDAFFERPMTGLARTPGWAPAMNLRRDGGDLVAELAIPGVAKEDIDIRLEGDVLTVSGEARSEKEVKEEDMYRREMFAGRFSRSLRLPHEVEADKIKAECKDGVLRIRLPFEEEARAERSVKIPIG